MKDNLLGILGVNTENGTTQKDSQKQWLNKQ